MEQRSELNPELFDMLKRGQLSSRKVVMLVELKYMVDSFATKNYIDDVKLEELKEKFGVYPDIITWGDFFQTEIASRFYNKSDAEFYQIIQTVRFDIISSHLIFSGKPNYFSDKVRGDALISKSLGISPTADLLLQDEENIHLEILLDYFENMGLEDKPLSISDRAWYESFDLQKIAI